MLLKQILDKFSLKEKSTLIDDQAIIDQYIKNPDFPWLISFPRTGSHWLRMLMELYFEKPGLRRAFFYHDAKDFTCFHWHDVDLSLTPPPSVIYLYRDPVETIYSQLQYHREDISDPNRVIYWAQNYEAHLNKWLISDSSTTIKTLIRYDRLKDDLVNEFSKICQHLRQPLDTSKIIEISTKVSKSRLKEKTKHDQQVVNTTKDYEILRKQFFEKNAVLIQSILFDKHPQLNSYFSSDK